MTRAALTTHKAYCSFKWFEIKVKTACIECAEVQVDSFISQGSGICIFRSRWRLGARL